MPNRPHNDSNAPMLPAPPCVSNEELAIKLNEVQDVVYEIRTAIKGNASMGHKGFSQRVEALEEKVEKHDRKLLVWGSILIAAGMSAQFLKEFIFQRNSGP